MNTQDTFSFFVIMFGSFFRDTKQHTTGIFEYNVVIFHMNDVFFYFFQEEIKIFVIKMPKFLGLPLGDLAAMACLAFCFVRLVLTMTICKNLKILHCTIELENLNFQICILCVHFS
jgi:hypothetical protein